MEPIENQNTMHILEGKSYRSYIAKEKPIYDFVKELSVELNERDFPLMDYVVRIESATYKGTFENYSLIKWSDDRQSVKVDFVGVLFGRGNKQLISLPKYAENFFEESGSEEIAQYYQDNIMMLMRRFQEPLQGRDDLFYNSSNQSANKLAFASALFELFETNGLYKEKSKIKSFKKGKMSWNDTVNKIVPDMIDDTIIYPKFIREKNISVTCDISMLQAAILNNLYEECGKRLKAISGGSMLHSFEKLPTVIDVDQVRKDPIEKSRWLRLIKEKQATCFKDHDTKLLNMLELFLKNTFTDADKNMPFYGVLKFERVFELALGEFFDNIVKIDQVETDDSDEKVVSVKLSSRHLGDSKESEDINQLYVNSIDYAALITDERGCRTKSPKLFNKKPISITNKGISIPDIIFEHQVHDEDRSEDCVIIADAKYYNYDIEDGVMVRLPQGSTVLKQFKYEDIVRKAYDKILEAKPNNLKFLNMFFLPWKRQHYTEEYDAAQTIKLVAVSELLDQRIFYFLIDFEQIIEFLKQGNSMSANFYKSALIGDVLDYLEDEYGKTHEQIVEPEDMDSGQDDRSAINNDVDVSPMNNAISQGREPEHAVDNKQAAANDSSCLSELIAKKETSNKQMQVVVDEKTRKTIIGKLETCIATMFLFDGNVKQSFNHWIDQGACSSLTTHELQRFYEWIVPRSIITIRNPVARFIKNGQFDELLSVFTSVDVAKREVRNFAKETRGYTSQDNPI